MARRDAQVVERVEHVGDRVERAGRRAVGLAEAAQVEAHGVARAPVRPAHWGSHIRRSAMPACSSTTGMAGGGRRALEGDAGGCLRRGHGSPGVAGSGWTPPVNAPPRRTASGYRRGPPVLHGARCHHSPCITSGPRPRDVADPLDLAVDEHAVGGSQAERAATRCDATWSGCTWATTRRTPRASSVVEHERGGLAGDAPALPVGADDPGQLGRRRASGPPWPARSPRPGRRRRGAPPSCATPRRVGPSRRPGARTAARGRSRLGGEPPVKAYSPASESTSTISPAWSTRSGSSTSRPSPSGGVVTGRRPRAPGRRRGSARRGRCRAARRGRG